jgi:hypothetical protein
LKAWREKTKQQFNELYSLSWSASTGTPEPVSKRDLQQICIPKDAERFYDCSRQSKLGLILSSIDRDEVESGLWTLKFKQGLKQISHVVTVQSLLPLDSSAENPCPISYFEVKTLNIADKEIKNFGLGLAGADYPIQRAVGSDNSIGLRGDGKIFVDNAEKFNLNHSYNQNTSSNLALNLKDRP